MDQGLGDATDTIQLSTDSVPLSPFAPSTTELSHAVVPVSVEVASLPMPPIPS